MLELDPEEDSDGEETTDLNEASKEKSLVRETTKKKQVAITFRIGTASHHFFQPF